MKFAIDRGEKLSEGRWSGLETIVVHEIISQMSHHDVSSILRHNFLF